MKKKLLFVLTDYDNSILGIEEVEVDMDEVNRLKKYDSKEGPDYLKSVTSRIIYKCPGVDKRELNHFSIISGGIISNTVLEYNTHEIIAWVIFNDEEWMGEHHGPQENGDYDYYE